MNENNRFWVSGKKFDARAGTSVSEVGDLNGNGIGDLIGGDFAILSGRANVVFGSQAPFPAQLNVGLFNGNDGVSLDNPIIPSTTGAKGVSRIRCEQR